MENKFYNFISELLKDESNIDHEWNCGNCTLIEHTKNDSFWGDNGDGTGENMLGQLLMNLRNNLPEYKPVFFVPQWIKYPDISPNDLFWRMGEGEDYLMKLAEWFNTLSQAAKIEYEKYFTPPEEWKDNFFK